MDGGASEIDLGKRPGRKADPQSGAVVFERHRAVVPPRDRAHKAEAETIPGVGAARLEADEAIEASRRAIPILKRLDDRIGLAKVHWGVGILLRERAHLSDAIDAYRQAQEQFEAIGMRADIAALKAQAK